METRLPFNSVDLSNRDRLAIADIVIKARRWPDVDIRADVFAGAYVGERDGERLKAERGALVTTYLIQLGIRPTNILIEPKTLTDEMVRKRDGTLDLHQVVIELFPLCDGSCARLCNDPRVIPKSKVIE
ncbi:hypothetical protein D0B32_03445 [Paraburkholderia sp. DHOC27]|nr:hypothetical protein D0B32_03445 [Paraburkholderia sp. DHOC27]